MKDKQTAVTYMYTHILTQCVHTLVNTLTEDMCRLLRVLLCQIKIHYAISTTEPPISPSNLFQTVVEEDRFSLLLNWTQHPPPSQNREVGSFVVELSIDGGTTFEEVYLYTCIIISSIRRHPEQSLPSNSSHTIRSSKRSKHYPWIVAAASIHSTWWL